MNGGLKIKRLTNKKGSPPDPRAATIKILANAPSKSVAVVAIAQTNRAHYSHTLASPAHINFEISLVLRLLLTTILMLTVLLSVDAQVIPDLVTGDHYRPYLTEGQKQEQILSGLKNYPKTSQELYPHLYKYTNQDYLAPIKGTPADPANAFKDYSKTEYFKPATTNNSGIPQSAYNNNLTIQQRNQAIIDADMAAYQVQKQRSEQLVNEAIKELEGPTIEYNLGVHDNKQADRFDKTFKEIKSILEGTQKIDFLKATWLIESSFDQSLSWEEFNKMFKDDVQIISQLLIQDKLSPSDNLSKLMSIYKFMADTTKVYIASKEKNIVSKPMLYDFEDYAAKIDPTKVFVSKLLRTGTGQCMSLPMLYYLFAKALGAEAYMAFAPQHSYIMFKDKHNVWQNIELTGRIFTTNDFIFRSGFIKTGQVKSGIYLKPISEKETLAHMLTTLAITYVRTFGTDDRVLEMAATANKYYPNDITSNMIMTGYTHQLWKNIERQYTVHGLTKTQLSNDEKAQQIKQVRDKLLDHLYKDLGWAKIPDDEYKKWLDGVNELAIKKQHIVRKRQLEQQLNK